MKIYIIAASNIVHITRSFHQKTKLHANQAASWKNKLLWPLMLTTKFLLESLLSFCISCCVDQINVSILLVWMKLNLHKQSISIYKLTLLKSSPLLCIHQKSLNHNTLLNLVKIINCENKAGLRFMKFSRLRFTFTCLFKIHQWPCMLQILSKKYSPCV